MRVLLLLVAAVTTTCSVQDNNKFYMPAEWEPHDAVWLGWEDDQLEYLPVVINMIKALKPHVAIKISASGDSLLRVAKKYLSEHGIDSTELQFHNIRGDSYWIRDYGAAFLVNGTGQLANWQWQILIGTDMDTPVGWRFCITATRIAYPNTFDSVGQE
jgi:agmatine deiminase